MLDIATYVLARGYTAAALANGAASGKEVEVDDVSGQLPESTLTELTKSTSAVIKLEGRYYRLTRIEGDNLKYINSTTNGSGQIINMTELDINKETGEFSTKQIIFEGSSVQYLEDALNTHIENTTMHVSAADRTN